MASCPNCHATLSPPGVFCGGCGARLGSSPVPGQGPVPGPGPGGDASDPGATVLLAAPAARTQPMQVARVRPTSAVDAAEAEPGDAPNVSMIRVLRPTWMRAAPGVAVALLALVAVFVVGRLTASRPGSPGAQEPPSRVAEAASTSTSTSTSTPTSTSTSTPIEEADPVAFRPLPRHVGRAPLRAGETAESTGETAGARRAPAPGGASLPAAAATRLVPIGGAAGPPPPRVIAGTAPAPAPAPGVSPAPPGVARPAPGSTAPAAPAGAAPPVGAVAASPPPGPPSPGPPSPVAIAPQAPIAPVDTIDTAAAAQYMKGGEDDVPPSAEDLADRDRAEGYAAAIRFVVHAHEAQVGACYERAFKTAPARSSVRVEIGFTVDPRGTPANVRAVSDTSGSPQLATCLSQRVLEWRFPRPPGGAFDAVYPFSFASGGR